jgi:hypothetical protein
MQPNRYGFAAVGCADQDGEVLGVAKALPVDDKLAVLRGRLRHSSPADLLQLLAACVWKRLDNRYADRQSQQAVDRRCGLALHERGNELSGAGQS